MARVTLGAIVTDIRGKLGGQVFKKTASGLVIQTKVKSRIKNDIDGKENLRVFNNMRRLAYQWTTLNSLQQSGWLPWLEYMGKFTVSFQDGRYVLKAANNVYMYVNSYNKWFGDTLLSTPNYYGINLPVIDDFDIETNGTILRVVNNIATSGTFYVVVKVTNRLRANNKTNQGKATRIMARFSNALVNLDITQEFINAFGALPVGGDTIKVELDTYDPLKGREFKSGIALIKTVGTYV